MKQDEEVVVHSPWPDKVHVSVLGSAAGWERFERQSKYTVGGFYCTCPFSDHFSNASFQTTAPPFSSPCPEAAACLVCVPAVLCPEMVNLLLDKAGFDVVKASSVPPGFNKQGTGENRGNIYYGRSVGLAPHNHKASITYIL